ncbi:putative peptidoglycan lipid II flippase [Paramicrobacterium humi]|uniref:Putative peptidoglycan lipid II flippase n=1 Tax=Paramicrobacterium humi TaxID=640635 RepID=A0A1H4KGW2_9MICO|nr:murein biosynthesis integral membrane protein MurJ [Microbacterium humi]SEB57486.1 putative peptidoglycan lipid II flippase [Microbacterium humi]
MTEATGREESIGRASLFLASGTVVSRVLGFIKAVLLASAIGSVASASADAFGVANQLPNQIYSIVAGGVFSAILVPTIVRAIVSEDRGRAYINKLLTVAVAILLGVTLLVCLAAPFIINIYLTSGEIDPAARALATAFAYWCLPQVFFYGLYSLLGEILNAHKLFGPFTWAPALNNVIAMLGLVAFMLIFGADPAGHRLVTEWTDGMITLLAGSATAGIAAQALVLFLFWRRIGLRYRPDFRWRGIGLRKTGKLAGWTFASLLLTQLGGVVQTNVSFLAAGQGASTAALQASWLIIMLPHSVIAVSVATAYFTRLAEHAHAGRIEAMKEDVARAARQITVLIVLAGAVIAVVALPFSSLFTGKIEQAGQMALVILAYLGDLLPFTLLFVIQRTFYALGDTRTPFFSTVVQSALFIALAVSCSLLPREWIGFGLAASISIAGVAQMTVGYLFLRRKIGGLGARAVLLAIGRFVLAAIPAAAVGWLITWLLGATREDGFAVGSVIGAVVTMAVVGIVMAVIYFGILIVTRSPDLKGALAPLRRKLGR